MRTKLQIERIQAALKHAPKDEVWEADYDAIRDSTKDVWVANCEEHPQGRRVAEYLAACNPVAIKELLDRLEVLDMLANDAIVELKDWAECFPIISSFEETLGRKAK